MQRLDAQRFRFLADALNGDGVFRPAITYDSSDKPIDVGATALVRHPREGDEKFARRNQLAWYENHLLSACRRFVGYLTKKPPLRDFQNPLLEEFAQDCDWRGNSLDVFMQSFMVEAKARGSMLLLVDMPDDEPPSLADQVEMRWLPYLVAIAPEQVAGFELDQRGMFNLIEWHITWEGRRAIKGFDKESWWIREGEKIVASGQHPLGLCPVVPFSEGGEFPAFGDFAQIADISKRLFNARSELDEVLRGQTFSIAVFQYPHDQPGARESLESSVMQVGTNNALVTPGDAKFIAPDAGPASVYLETITRLEEALQRVALVVEPPDNQQASGVALTIRFQALNSALTAFARRMEDFERRLWDVVCAWLGLPFDRVVIEWAKDYAIADLQRELDVLTAMQMAGFPDAAIRQQQKQVAGLAFSAADPEIVQEVMDAIDEGNVEVIDEGAA